MDDARKTIFLWLVDNEYQVADCKDDDEWRSLLETAIVLYREQQAKLAEVRKMLKRALEIAEGK